MRTSPLFLICLLAGSGCATGSGLSPEDREALRRALLVKDNEAFLRLSYFVTAFFEDTSRRLLTPFPPEEVRAVYQTVSPGPIERTIPAGTRVQILRVEFPTSWVVTARPPQSPRNDTWIYLGVVGQKESPPLVLVLPSRPQSKEEFRALLDRYLTLNDPTALLSSWPENVQVAVRSKNAVVDMPADALEMALGYPESKQISFEDSVRKEEWIYPGRHRVVSLASGRVVRVEPQQSP